MADFVGRFGGYQASDFLGRVSGPQNSPRGLSPTPETRHPLSGLSYMAVLPPKDLPSPLAPLSAVASYVVSPLWFTPSILPVFLEFKSELHPPKQRFTNFSPCRSRAPEPLRS